MHYIFFILYLIYRIIWKVIVEKLHKVVNTICKRSSKSPSLPLCLSVSHSPPISLSFPLQLLLCAKEILGHWRLIVYYAG